MRTYANIKSYRKALSDFPLEKNSVKSVIKFCIGLFFSFYVSQQGDFEGEILYFSTILEQRNRDLKIFSLKKSKIIILFANKVRALLYYKNRQKTENKFPLTKLYEFNEKQLYAIDEYIVTKDANNVSVEIIGELLEFYLRYYFQCKDKCDFVNSEEINFLEKYKLSLKECPTLFLAHADLSKDNYIYVKEERKFIFIDFDHMDYYPPFYDVFFLILNQIVAMGDYSLVQALNDGIYDKYFISYAEQNNITLIDIFVSCIKCLWYKRLYMLNDRSKKEMIKVLSEIVKKLKGRYTNV